MLCGKKVGLRLREFENKKTETHHFVGGPRVDPRVHLPRLPGRVLHVGDAHPATVELKINGEIS